MLQGRTRPRGTLRVTKAPKTERELQGLVPKERRGEMCQSDSVRESLGRVAASQEPWLCCDGKMALPHFCLPFRAQVS